MIQPQQPAQPQKNHMILETSIHAMFTDHIVYEIADQNYQLLFVGVSKFIDALLFAELKNNTAFQQSGSISMVLRVNLAFTGTAKECYAYAFDVIQRRRPVYNMTGYDSSRIKRSVMCINDKQVFASQNDAARYYDLSQSALSKHLQGNKGARTVKGRMFRYLTADEVMNGNVPQT